MIPLAGVIYLCATIAHIIDGCRYVALGVCYLDQSVDTIILERSGNDTIWSAELLGLHRLATTVGVGCLTITNASVQSLRVHCYLRP